jgi:hypothetical protein
MEQWNDALLFRELATLRLDVPVFDDLGELEWHGPKDDFESVCNRLKAKDLYKRSLRK